MAEELRQDENSYSSIMKRISAFGGVQVLNILINLVRGKFVAMILGPEGMGVSSMFTLSANTVQQFSSLGLNYAVVREVAAAKDDEERLPHILSVVTRLILVTSLLGAVVCAIMAPLLSRWSFDNYDYTGWFVVLGVSVAFSIGGAGYLALLQGAGEVKRLSRAALVGSLTGLLCGVPLYYLFGTRGIVPAMIILSLAIFLFYYLTFRKTRRVASAAFKWSDHKTLIKKLLSLGFVLMIGSLVGTATNYAINVFIRFIGTIDDVGLFQAANSITNQYVGIVFSALAADYFPRLSALGDDRERIREVVGRQTEVVMLVVTPLVMAMIITAPWIIRVLLSDEFLSVTPLIRWMAIAVMIQAMAFPLEYLYLARDDRKVFIWLEVVGSNIVWMVAAVVMYYSLGLLGLGISVVIRWVFDLVMDIIVCHRRYGVAYSHPIWRLNVISLVGVTLTFLLSMISDNVYAIVGMIALLVGSILVSVIRLRRRLKG